MVRLKSKVRVEHLTSTTGSSTPPPLAVYQQALQQLERDFSVYNHAVGNPFLDFPRQPALQWQVLICGGRKNGQEEEGFLLTKITGSHMRWYYYEWEMYGHPALENFQEVVGCFHAQDPLINDIPQSGEIAGFVRGSKAGCL
ncbi:uncharacterized protein LDX57_000027 [Aspergillus melleus]|uniref:uncharacterized protein n=1 Tax=Aspergillus melleus TaxID=138277 RepID=UPI001E8EE1F0|nr:uncharacterized protein LDX57_000027 [Aspergillus melleus]KAH8422269.1 hypothetical protein LDX57_000027 [Aspergillus melleus]